MNDEYQGAESADPDNDNGAQGEAEEAGPKKRPLEWITSPACVFLQRLCPGGPYDSLPTFEVHFPDGSVEICPDHIVKKGFERGFRRLEDHLDLKTMQAVRGELTSGEFRVWHVIKRKTLRYGHIAEKLSRRIFTEGDLDPKTGKPRHNKFRMPTIAETGLSDSSFNKAVNGLVDKGWISRWESEAHPKFSKSTIYTPVHLAEALHFLLAPVEADIDREYNGHDAETGEMIWEALCQTFRKHLSAEFAQSARDHHCGYVDKVAGFMGWRPERPPSVQTDPPPSVETDPPPSVQTGSPPSRGTDPSRKGQSQKHQDQKDPPSPSSCAAGRGASSRSEKDRTTKGCSSRGRGTKENPPVARPPLSSPPPAEPRIRVRQRPIPAAA